jgi:hypothetical protein
MNPISPETQKILGICVVALGIVYCFFGYRFFRIALFSTGFMSFSLASTYISYLIFPRSDAPAVVAALVGGLAGGVLFYFVYLIGVFALGGAFGALVGMAVTAVAGRDIQPLLIAVLAVVAGSLAILLQKHIIILATSFGGAGAIVLGGWYVAKGVAPATLIQDPSSLGREFHAIVACWFIGSIIGTVLQYTVTGTPKEEEKDEEEPKEVKEVRPRTATRPKTGSPKKPRQPTQKKPKTQPKKPPQEKPPQEKPKKLPPVKPPPPSSTPAPKKSTLPPLKPAPKKSEEEEWEEL